MLQQIRDRAHGLIAWIVVILICIPFALWGVQEYLGPDPNVAVAEVEGEEISLFEYQTALQEVRAALGRQFPGQDASRLLGETLIREQAMEGLVRDRLLVAAASRAGFVVSDEQLASAIRAFPAFQRDGRFSSEEYEFALRRTGSTPGRFEAEIRQQLIEDQWRDAFVLSAIADERRAMRLAHLASQERVFSQLVVPAERFGEAEISEEEVAAYYEQHRESFMSREEVRLRYLVLARADVASEIEIPPGTLEGYYEARKAGYAVPEQRRVSHILVTGEEGAEEDARVRAEALRARVLAGESFEAVAREASEDSGSAEQGGDLGFEGRGVWDPAFEEMAFSLPVGKLSEPVRSAFGFHLIRVTDIREGSIRAFEEVREELEEEYRGDQAEQLYFERVERLANLVYEHPDNLEDAAEVLGLNIDESGFLSRRGVPGDEVLGDPAVAAAAFSEDVLAGNNSEPIEIDGYRTVVLRVEERREPRQRTLDEARPEIIATLRTEHARTETRESGMELLRRLRSGEEMEAVAGELAWSEERSVRRRQEADLDRPVREVLFTMPHPEAGATVFDAVALANGDFVVLALREVVETEVEEEEFETFRDRLARRLGIATHDAFVAALRERAEVRFHENRMGGEGDYATQ